MAALHDQELTVLAQQRDKDLLGIKQLLQQMKYIGKGYAWDDDNSIDLSGIRCFEQCPCECDLRLKRAEALTSY